jgi:hypothetical protein
VPTILPRCRLRWWARFALPTLQTTHRPSGSFSIKFSNSREDTSPQARGARRPSVAIGVALHIMRGRREGRVSADTHGPRA